MRRWVSVSLWPVLVIASRHGWAAAVAPHAVGGSPDHEPPIATRVVAAMGAGREGEVTEVRTLPFQAFAVLLGNGDLTGAKLQSHW